MILRPLVRFGLFMKRECGCLHDVSVIGFDDVLSAPYGIPSLTTIRQPLREMGKMGAECLLHRIDHPKASYSRQVIVQPELVVRESTGPARNMSQKQNRPASRTQKVRTGRTWEPMSSSLPCTIAPWLSVRKSAQAVDFYKSAFGATEVFRLDGPDGSVVARLSVEGAEFWLRRRVSRASKFQPRDSRRQLGPADSYGCRSGCRVSESARGWRV